MTNLFLDTNIVIDVVTARAPFLNASARLFSLAENGKINLFISSLSYWNIYYIVKKASSHAETIEILKGLNKYITPVDVTKEVINEAINSDFKDFEDAIQYFSAKSHQCIDAIITRNPKDFKFSSIPLLLPQDVVVGS